MTTWHEQLREALAAFVAASATRDPDTISRALNRVLKLESQLGDDAPPMLRHYLDRRSYQKALDFLNTGHPETQTPQCGH